MLKYNSEIIVIGQLGGAHGVKGRIKVHSFTQPADNILIYQPWLIQTKQGWQCKNFVKAERMNRFYSVLLENCPTREQAESYRNCHIGIYQDQLSTLDETQYYWHELMGMTVVTVRGETLGIVKQLIETGSNDVLIVEGEKRHLIPFLLDDCILKINRDAAEITVEWDPDF